MWYEVEVDGRLYTCNFIIEKRKLGYEKKRRVVHRIAKYLFSLSSFVENHALET